MGSEPAYTGGHSWEIFEVVAPARLAGWQPESDDARPDPAPPRPAATVVPVRDGPQGLRVWMLRRRLELVFGGCWVFPGGKLDAIDAASPDPLVACALREYAEEAGLTAAPEALHPWARWITPVEAPARFDTRFYVTRVPDHAEPVDASGEADLARWLAPADLVADQHPAAGMRAERPMLMVPTRAILWELALLGSWEAVEQAAATREIQPVLGRRRRHGDTWRLSHPRRDGSWT